MRVKGLKPEIEVILDVNDFSQTGASLMTTAPVFMGVMFSAQTHILTFHSNCI